eukprot:8264274-Heterocapsa_arctica.AAC.1
MTSSTACGYAAHFWFRCVVPPLRNWRASMTSAFHWRAFLPSVLYLAASIENIEHEEGGEPS